MDLSRRVLRTVRKFGMVPRGGRVLAAVSGGPDSIGLVHVLRELERAGELSLVGIAHLNHRLRAAADEDERFCCDVATQFAVPIRIERVDVGDRARQLRTSIEDAGRRARYEFFERAATELGADAIATGHTRDDQAETFLLRLIRGAGPRGLSGIHPRTGRVVRPLIEIGRNELHAWLTEREISYRTDESNRDLSFARNRIRHELIPYLQSRFSPGIVEVLARDAAISREDEDRLHQEAIEQAASVVLINDDGRQVPPTMETPGISRVAGREPDCVEVDVPRLTSLHPALAFRVGRLALSVLAPGRFAGYEDVERLLELVSAAEGSARSLPGQHAIRRGHRIVLRRRLDQPFENSFSVPLSIPGEVVLDAQGWAVSAIVGSVPEGGSDPRPDPLTVPVLAARLVLPLTVRSRRRGDRFRPGGLGGRGKKLQDFLVDRKVPRETRDLLPLVVNGDDRIVWVVGQSVAEDFRVTEPSQGVILLKARRLGGVG